MEKNTNLIKTFNYAIDGIIYTLKSQRNMKIHYAIAILVLFLTLFLNLSRIEIIAVFFSISLVILSEMFNTAIEKTVDLVTTEYSPLAKIAKDVAAGAVLVSALNSIMVAYLVFFDRLNPFTLSLLIKIKNQDVHVTIIGIIITLLFVVAGKTLSPKGSHVQGGVVSGHAALSFALATSIGYISENALVATLSFMLALLVAQSRIEGRIHTLREVIYGGVLGILVITLLFKVVF
ncbi:Phosphoesterase, PA-phosphatase related:Prokaryotic diacylglycerol kinase [Acetoanaerobium sticklandii]|uniref:Phosphoesterase, PA-phosphatase related:Prokaryotic diacylglycerol kinase n=1 Tax=Acetoanaerobium sticklandii (strain ATCC 12662 / DSM 519 / JCM 1433 / CCUG 9281 / NCIMB 10654 / HF) TaxID=499177 RepID=E3PSP2_ACESD|nr:diacylglycerol kinase [Acetoanaerobium sticklandii]CBH21896.1 Phosphoesterase, PA-phosphatase related:Prokaryotic diacylglycerol kinase [Acetoanaerobium sticklandii]